MYGVTHRDRAGNPAQGYYRCHAKDPVDRRRPAPCPQPSAKAAELDAAVWAHVKALLDDPATLLAQFEAAARSGTEVPEEGKAEAQLRRLDREERRLVDAYQAGAIELAELKDRRQQIAGRRQVLVAQRDHQAQLRGERDAARRVYDDLTAFCARVRARLDEATVEERQRVLQLLVERVIVGTDTLEVRHVIPLRPPAPRGDPNRSLAGGPDRIGDDPPGGPDDVNGRAGEPCIRLRSLRGTAAASVKLG